jgi:small subunit ribosomal protein S21
MKIERRDGESIEQLLRRFNKVVVAERITKTYREMQFVSKSEQRKEKVRRAERNRRKKMAQTGH